MLFVAAVAAVITVVMLATKGEQRTAGLVTAQLVFISGMSYLITFLVWPRQSPVSSAHPSHRVARGPVPDEPRLNVDERPVLVIGHRPAGSPPASRVHIRDIPTTRTARGRKPGERQPTGEFRWPAQRQ